MNILSVAYPLAPVSPDSTGGAEQMVCRLDMALTECGHRSIVVAREDSRTAGELVPVPAFTGEYDEPTRRKAQALTREAIRCALQKFDVDIVHLHGIDFQTYIPPDEVPALVTLHLPPDWYPLDVFRSSRPRTFLNCVSQTQQTRCPSSSCLLPPIENGICLDTFRPGRAKDDFLLALGRICPEKGFHIAMDAARRAGVRLFLGGQVYPYKAHQRYWAEEIETRLDGNREFLGLLDLTRKCDLLQRARCLLVPSLAPETSSLVAMEALACGTPVIAFPSGALSEIVQHGVTGFLVQNEQEMADAIGHIDEIDPSLCRFHAEEHFDLTHTIERYLETYEHILSRPTISVPRYRTIVYDDPRAIESEWQRLYRSCENLTPFSNPAWLVPWYEEVCEQRASLLTVWRDGHLAALAPLTVTGELAGTGISDYLDLVANSPDALESVWKQVAQSGCGWDDLRADSNAIRFLPERLRRDVEEGSVCPYVDVQNSRLPAKLLKNIRSQQHKLGGEIETATEGSLDEFLDALFELHEVRWNGKGVLGESRIQSFHRRAARGLLASDELRFTGLRVGGKLRAVLYCFARNNRLYYYLSGFETELAALSPGNLLIHDALLVGDLSEFDFLRGTEAYKYRWGATDRTSLRLRVSRKTFPG